ncbi:MAG: carboxymuconolactone decarboxylase family protein [Rhodospirillales bacterium]|jgi:alkylhydroperoxidase/carboxymuconolactone decarboxylase family protein YurZ|nr:carboxymuconolactone decarboxylase family protein [Rhodospirillales bacterium]
MSRDPDPKANLDAWSKQSLGLAYRRMMGATDPEVLEAWNSFYRRLILSDRSLDAASCELILLSLLTTTREAHGRIHVGRARDAGVDDDRIASAIALGGAFDALSTHDFVVDNWPDEVDEGPVLDLYLAGVERVRGTIEAKLCEIMAVACHAAKRRRRGLRLHLGRAFAAGATVAEVSEALSFLIMVCSVPTLTDAALEWAAAARDGVCPPPYDDAPE